MAAKIARQVAGFFVMVLLICALPIYYFFFHCPASTELLAVKRQLRIGMKVEEAERLMPSGYLKVATDDDAIPFGILENEKRGRGAFTGYLRDLDPCSVQCAGILDVKCSNGVVVDVKLGVYNDFNHTIREID